MSRFFAGVPVAIPLVLVLASTAHAHGIVGDRFFPATITTDDPFAADELALPTVNILRHKDDDGDAVNERDYTFEYSKTIWPKFAISFAGGYVDSNPAGGRHTTGWTNFEITPTWQFMSDAPGEFVASAAIGFEIGGSGAHSIADGFTTTTPTLLVGKGFGDLPDSMALLRPLALTATVGYAIPGRAAEPRSLQWGGALEYSLLYLQDNVRNQGFGSIVTHLTPLVEFSLSSPQDGGTTGTVNPGLLWSGQYTQIGAEMVIPVNRATGGNIGAIMQLHFYVDDIFPHSLGSPLFGSRR